MFLCDVGPLPPHASVAWRPRQSGDEEGSHERRERLEVHASWTAVLKPVADETLCVPRHQLGGPDFSKAVLAMVPGSHLIAPRRIYYFVFPALSYDLKEKRRRMDEGL